MHPTFEACGICVVMLVTPFFMAVCPLYFRKWGFSLACNQKISQNPPVLCTIAWVGCARALVFLGSIFLWEETNYFVDKTAVVREHEKQSLVCFRAMVTNINRVGKIVFFFFLKKASGQRPLVLLPPLSDL